LQTDFQDEKEAFHKYMEKFGECRDGSNPGQFLMVSTEFESVPRTYTAQIAYIMHMPSYNTYVYIYIPVVPHKAVREVSKIGNL